MLRDRRDNWSAMVVIAGLIKIGARFWRRREIPSRPHGRIRGAHRRVHHPENAQGDSEFVVQRSLETLRYLIRILSNLFAGHFQCEVRSIKSH